MATRTPFDGLLILPRSVQFLTAASRSSTAKATWGTVLMISETGEVFSKRIHSIPYGLVLNPDTYRP